MNLIGKSLGRYHILEQLGEGGMAVVYKAFDTRLERDVAIKIIRRGAFPPEQLERILKRFEREAKALARLSHANIVGVIDFGEYEGSPYLVMEYLPGGTLKKWLGKPMPWSEAVRLLIPVTRALHFAHCENIIHRDVKPANILITRSGDPMLTDFGIAKLLDLGDTQTLTGTGVGIGTPEYMSPEQGLGKEVDGRSDIYSLGVVFYELITGRKPYTADTPMAVVFKHLTDPLPNPKEFTPDLPDAVVKVLLKALAKNPNDRYGDMDSFAVALEGLLIRTGLAQPTTTPKPVEKTMDQLKPPPALAITRHRTLGKIGLSVGITIVLLSVLITIFRKQPNVITTPTSTTAPPAATPTSTFTPVPPTPTQDPSIAIQEVFNKSKHADLSSASFTYWADGESIPPQCVRCHTSTGFQNFITYGEETTDLIAPAGTLECATCHNDAAKTLTAVTFASGIVIQNLNTDGLCNACHQARSTGINVDQKIAEFAGMNRPNTSIPDLSMVNLNPHYGIAGGLLQGTQSKTGYEYPGKIYKSRYIHVNGYNTCRDCHDPHSLEIKIEQCATCHEGIVQFEDIKTIRHEKSNLDFDGDGNISEGIAFEISHLTEALYKVIISYAQETSGTTITFDSSTFPFWFEDRNLDGSPDQDESGNWIRFTTFTPRLLRAAFNYQMNLLNPDSYAHNPGYMLQLLFDSIEDLGGDVSKYSRP